MDSNHNLGANGAGEVALAPALTEVENEQVASGPPKRGKKGKYQGQTGPRSKRGKEISRKNGGMIHGLRAKKLLMPFEDPGEYEKHLAGIIKTLGPQDMVESAIVEAYAYAIWSSPRCESYQQSLAKKQYRQFKPEWVAECLGLDKRYQKNAPHYLLNIEYEVSTERMNKAAHLVNCYQKIKGSIEDDDLGSLDWAKTLEHYRELFDVLHEWLTKRGDEVAVYGDDGKTLHEQQLENLHWLWGDLQDLNCFLYFELNFMDLKPQIAVHLERVYWDNAFQAHLGFTDHFQRTQNFAFHQLERLASYRQMKQKFAKFAEMDTKES